MIGTLAGTIRRLALFVGLLFLALLVNVNLVQVTRANSLAQQPSNNRNVIKEYARQRGPILVGNTPVAESVATSGQLKYQRTYAAGPMYVPATGFYSLVYGRTAIERIEDAVLSGTDPRFSIQQVADLIAGRTTKGGSVRLTLNAKAQAAAYAGMRGKVGAVVAIEPATGRILALVQSPSFDPGLISSNDPSIGVPFKEPLGDIKLLRQCVEIPRCLNDKKTLRSIPPGFQGCIHRVRRSTTTRVVTIAELDTGNDPPIRGGG